jgi:polyisoprenoid-binding protein YceI
LFAFVTVLGTSSVALAQAAKAPAAPKPGAYTVDPVHSFALFKIQHFGAGFVYGQFKELEGKLSLDADASKDTLEVTIKTASVDTHDAKRDGHLQSPDFFNAAQFPTITFKSTKVAKNADGTLDVTGDLTIRGKTKSVVAKVTATGAALDPFKKYRAGFEGKATVNRNDFDLSFMPGALGDTVEILLALESIAQ